MTASLMRRDRLGARARQFPQVDVLVIALFATCQLYTPLFGQLYLLEAGMSVAALAVLVTNRSTTIETSRPLTLLMVLLLLWLSMSIISDFTNHVSDTDTLRGAVRAGFLLTNIVLLSFWSRRTPGVLHSIWIGYALSFAVSYVVQPSTDAHTEVWKFSVALPLAVLCAVALDRSGLAVRARVVALGAMAALDFALGARSVALILLGAAVLTWTSSRGFRKPGLAKLAAAGLVMAASGVVVILAYDHLAEQGDLGERAQIKASYQADGAYGSLLGGRPESFVATRVIAEHPILGAGSYSLPDSTELAQARRALDDLGYEHISVGLADIRNYHSQLLGTWAENGIAAAAFWLVVLGVCVEAARRIVAGGVTSVCLVGLLTCSLAWDVLFSPFGADRRLFVAISLVTIVHHAFSSKEAPVS